MLLRENNWSLFNHHFFWLSPVSIFLISVDEGNNIFLEHVRTGSLFHPTKRLKVFLDVDEGLLRVCSVPLGLVLTIEVVIVILFSCPFKV